MVEEIILQVINVLSELAIMLIGVGGTWLTYKLGQNKHIETINAAQQEVINMAQITVGELAQTTVVKLKAAHEDGKLTQEEIKKLGYDLFNMTVAKLSDPTRALLRAAGVDITELIRGAGEDWINSLKKED